MTDQSTQADEWLPIHRQRWPKPRHPVSRLDLTGQEPETRGDSSVLAKREKVRWLKERWLVCLACLIIWLVIIEFPLSLQLLSLWCVCEYTTAANFAWLLSMITRNNRREKEQHKGPRKVDHNENNDSTLSLITKSIVATIIFAFWQACSNDWKMQMTASDGGRI